MVGNDGNYWGAWLSETAHVWTPASRLGRKHQGFGIESQVAGAAVSDVRRCSLLNFAMSSKKYYNGNSKGREHGLRFGVCGCLIPLLARYVFIWTVGDSVHLYCCCVASCVLHNMNVAVLTGIVYEGALGR